MPRNRPTGLFLMPSFERHAARRDWEDLEAFYNPENVFGRVILVSLGLPRPARERIGSLEILALPHLNPHPHLLALGERAYGAIDRVAGALERIARSCEADLLVQRYGSPLWHGTPIVWTARRLGRPSIITYQADYHRRTLEPPEQARPRPGLATARSRLMAWLDPVPWTYLHRHATAVWAVSEYLAERIMAQGVERSRIVTIANKDRVARFAATASEAETSEVLDLVGIADWADREVLLCVGRLIAEKNHGRVLDAFAATIRANPRARLLIIGQGPLEGALRTQMEQLNVSGHARLCTRYLSQQQLAVLYQRAAALVFCSLSEGQGRVAFEALAAGTPVIGADLPPIAEILTDEAHSALVDPTDSHAIGTAMLSLTSRTAEARRHRADRQRAAARFDLSTVNPQEAALYRKLLHSE